MPRPLLSLLALILASSVSLIGSQLSSIAIPWFVLQSTGSAALTGIAASVMFLSRFLLGLMAGALVDRLGYRRASVAADIVSGVGIALVPVLYFAFGFVFWQFLLAVALVGAPDILGLSARRSLLPAMAAASRTRLERVTGAYEGTQNVASLVGPPLGGLLITELGARNVFWIDAASFLASALIIGLAVQAVHEGPPAPVVPRYSSGFAAGARYLRRDAVLLTLAVTVAASNLIGAGSTSVALPVYAKTVLGQPIALGLMFASLGAGALAGSFAFSAIGHRLPRRGLWTIAFVAMPLEYWALVAHPALPILMAILFAPGLLAGALNPLGVTIRQERIPLPIRGSVFSMFSAIVGSTLPAGTLIAGLLIAQAGLWRGVLVLAVSGQILGLLVAFAPALRELDRRQQPAK